MDAIIGFITGRSNKLLRDILITSFFVVGLCMVALLSINKAVETILVARQPLPSKVQTAQNQQSSGQITTITRSVLDDPILTGSISGRPIVLDPCTGKEKK
jgi:Flp pilus assembly protein protease CpaA